MATTKRVEVGVWYAPESYGLTEQVVGDVVVVPVRGARGPYKIDFPVEGSPFGVWAPGDNFGSFDEDCMRASYQDCVRYIARKAASARPVTRSLTGSI